LVGMTFLLFSVSVEAQNNATEGTEFYLNFTSNAASSAGTSGLYIQIRYVVADTCYITTQYGDGSYLDNNVRYLPGTYTKNLDKSKCYTNPIMMGFQSNNLFLKVTSTRKIGLYASNMYLNTTDATTILPVEVLGRNYTIISNTNGTGASISIIAPSAGTVINIKNAAGTVVVANQAVSTGLVYIYSVMSGDLTGYTVEANNPVCVFSSVQCGNQVCAGACEHNWEQLFPTNNAGRHYYVWNMSSNTTNCTDQIKILALENNTTVTKKTGASVSSVILNRLQTNVFNTVSAANTYVNNSAGITEIISDKPVIVENILGYAPCIKWIFPIEQRITAAVISPFVPFGTSFINAHQLHIIIPANAENDMEVREIRNGVETTVNLTFYTNITDSNYKIAFRQYAQYDSALIYLTNPSGFIAYLTGYGNTESYIITAGAGAFDLSCYFSVNGTHYQMLDGKTLCGTGIRTFEASFWGAANTQGHLKWYINGVEELSARDSMIWSKNIDTGTFTVLMEVLDNNNVWHQYSTTFTVAPVSASVSISASENDVCTGRPITFTAVSENGGLSPVYQWVKNDEDIQDANSPTYTCLPDNGDVISCKMISSADCAAPKPAISNVVNMNIRPKEIPTINIRVIRR